MTKNGVGAGASAGGYAAAVAVVLAASVACDASAVLVCRTERDAGSSERLATLLTLASCAGAHCQQSGEEVVHHGFGHLEFVVIQVDG